MINNPPTMTQTQQACAYTRLENGVHVFTLHESSPAAIDQYIEHANRIYETVTATDHLLFLVDIRESGTVPISYGFRRGRAWVQSLKIHPRVRMAVLYKDAFLMTMFESLVKTMRWGHLEMKLFSPSAGEDAALAWLEEKRLAVSD